MDWLRTSLLEDPFYLYLGLGLAVAALLAGWYSRRRGRLLLAAGVLAAIGVGVYILERAVVTDREKIRAALDDIAAAVERGDIDAAGAWLDEKYTGWGVGNLRLGKSAAILAAKVVVNTYKVRQVQYLGKPEITVSGKTAASRLRTAVHYGRQGEGGGRVLLAWEVEWVKRTEGWRIRRATRSDDVMP